MVYKEVKLNAGYRIDILVENKLIIEIKAVSALADIHTAQLLTYLKLKDIKLGLLINFNSVRIIDGVKRIINGYLSSLLVASQAVPDKSNAAFHQSSINLL